MNYRNGCLFENTSSSIAYIFNIDNLECAFLQLGFPIDLCVIQRSMLYCSMRRWAVTGNAGSMSGEMGKIVTVPPGGNL